MCHPECTRLFQCPTYESAVVALQAQYVKTPNEVFARHLLATRRQQEGESLDEFFRALKVLSKDCNFKSVNATQHCEESIRDSFISGLRSPSIRQRLLENKSLDLTSMFDQARALESAQINSELYFKEPVKVVSATHEHSVKEASEVVAESVPLMVAANTKVLKCYFCGSVKHPRAKCPAREAICHKCQKQGHFAKVCKSSVTSASVAPASRPTLATVTSAVTPKSLSKAVAKITIKGKEIEGLIDSGSSESFIHPDVVTLCSLKTEPSKTAVSMASTSLSARTAGACCVNIKVNERDYQNVRLTVLPNLCSDVILGQDFQRLHETVTLAYGGNLPSLVICGVSALKIEPPELFANLTADCHPIATKSRRYSADDREFISGEVDRLLSDGIIEKSKSPWRAQVVVVKSEARKKRLAVDYSQTINKFTLLDSYPLPRIDDTVNKIAQYKVFSKIDLRSAYHQVALREKEKPYTAFEACGKLYQFTRVPFGVTNGVACFQRIMDTLRKRNSRELTRIWMTSPYVARRRRSMI